MTLFSAGLAFVNDLLDRFPKRVSARVVEGVNPVPENMARDAVLEELQLDNQKLRMRLHRTKQHNKAVTQKLLELSQKHAALQTECERLKAESGYWHARTTQLVREKEGWHVPLLEYAPPPSS